MHEHANEDTAEVTLTAIEDTARESTSFNEVTSTEQTVNCETPTRY